MNKTCETCAFWKGDSSSYMAVCDLPTSGAARTEFNHSCSAHTMKKELIVPDSPVNQPRQQQLSPRDYSNIRASMFPGFNIPMEIVKEELSKFKTLFAEWTISPYKPLYIDNFTQNINSVSWVQNDLNSESIPEPRLIDLSSGSIQSYTQEIKVVKYGTQFYADHEDSINPTYEEIRRNYYEEQARKIQCKIANMIACGNGLDCEITYIRDNPDFRIISASLPARHYPPIESLSEPLNDTDSDDDTDTNPT